MKTKDRKIRDAEILGMPAGTAQVRLLKALVLSLAQQVGREAQCRNCSGWIDNPDDLAIEHISPWRQFGAAAYWDLNNVALRHKGCSSQPATPRHSKMKNVQITIENLQGHHLRSFTSDDGKFHVSGEHGVGYQIRVKNITSRNIEVVTTVDGRDVCSGEVGDASAHGYMLRPYADIVIKGFRRSMTETTQFRFSPKSESYSAKMGTAQNVGVIGVAVFQEKVIKSALYSGGIYTSRGIDFTADSAPACASASFTDTSCDISQSTQTVGTSFSSDVLRPRVSGSIELPKNTRRLRGTRSRRSTRQDIGTEFSGSVRDSVQDVSFTRDSEAPDETDVIHYDTFSALMEKGRMTEVGQISREPIVVGQEPDPFPNSPKRFAQPPPG